VAGNRGKQPACRGAGYMSQQLVLISLFQGMPLKVRAGRCLLLSKLPRSCRLPSSMTMPFFLLPPRGSLSELSAGSV